MSETIKITNRDLVKLHNALNSLDCSRKGKDEVVPFEFDPKVSWALAKNEVIVERARLAFDKAVKQQARQAGLSPGESIRVGENETPDPKQVAKFAAFEDAVESIKDEVTEITGLLFIRLTDLLTKPANADGKVGQNPIPQSVRIGLIPIIKEDTA